MSIKHDLETQELKSTTPSTKVVPIDAQLIADASAATVTVSGLVESGLVEGIKVGTSVEASYRGAKEGMTNKCLLVEVGICLMGRLDLNRRALARRPYQKTSRLTLGLGLLFPCWFHILV